MNKMPNSTLVRIIIIVITFLATKDAATSQIIFQKIDLQELAVSAQWIVLAKYNKSDDTGPPLRYFTVIKHLGGIDQEPFSPMNIVVRDAGYAQGVMAGIAYKQNGVRRSPLIKELIPGKQEKFLQGKEYILFLQDSHSYSPKEYEFTAKNGYLSAKKQFDVDQALLKAGTSPHELVFLGKILEIVNAPEKNEGAIQKSFVIKTKIVRIIKGTFSGDHFSFRIHSPAKSRVKKGMEIKVKAIKTRTGYNVEIDP